jgi:hypothetical protein
MPISRGLQEVEVPKIFVQHIKAVRLLVVRAVCIYPQEYLLGVNTALVLIPITG